VSIDEVSVTVASGGTSRQNLRNQHRLCNPRLNGGPLSGERPIFWGTFALVHSRERVHYLTMLQRVAHSDPGDLAKLGELILDIRVAFLTTVDRDGRFIGSLRNGSRISSRDKERRLTDGDTPRSRTLSCPAPRRLYHLHYPTLQSSGEEAGRTPF
jgi:hypothetical protein